MNTPDATVRLFGENTREFPAIGLSVWYRTHCEEGGSTKYGGGIENGLSSSSYLSDLRRVAITRLFISI